MNTKRIIIDGRMYNESGIGRYIRNLVSNLQIIDHKNEYFILHLKKDYYTLIYRRNFHKVLADFRWYGVGEQLKLPELIYKLQPDIVHFPHFNVPLLYLGKFVVTIHDLIHQHFQMRRATTLHPLFYKVKQLGYNKVFKNAITKSLKILAPSEFIKNQLIREWYVSGDKIMVTPEAVDNNIAAIVKLVREKEAEKTMKKFNIKKPYLFYVGNAHPHKNVEGLIKVFKKLKEKYQDLSLVLSGNDHYFWQRIRDKFQDKGIIYIGYISDSELVALYKNAQCFVMPSLEEGFGIPILEAMVCSCPVVSSNKGSLKEVGGDAALYFDPQDIQDIGDKIIKVLEDKDLRRQLIEKGRKRANEFSWEKLAQKTLEIYLRCV